MRNPCSTLNGVSLGNLPFSRVLWYSFNRTVWSHKRACDNMSPENVQLVSSPREACSETRWPVFWPWPKWNSDSGVMEMNELYSRSVCCSSSVINGACENIIGHSSLCNSSLHNCAGDVFAAARRF